jgi:Tol biopolymer transport system component
MNVIKGCLAALAATTALTATTGLTATPAEAATPALDRQIAYVRSGVIYTGNGATERRLTPDGQNSRPRWSPDGSRIAYLHKGTVWVINADGTGRHQVAGGPAGGPAWSPDGTSIAYAAPGCTGGPAVYRISTAQPGAAPQVLFPVECRGSAPSHATGQTAGSGDLAGRLRHDDAVAWSPDGTRIAFRGGGCEGVYDDCLSVGDVSTGAEATVDAYGGGGVERSGFAVLPAWRPDGARLSWTAYQDGAAIHVVEADPTGANARTVGTADDRELAYLDADRAVLTATHGGRSWVTLLDLRTGTRRYLRTGSQPSTRSH